MARQTVPTVHNGIFECALEEQQLWGKVGERGWNTVPWGAVSDVLVTTDEPSSQPSTHQPEISHTGPQLEKCHWCTLTYIWRNELHYLFTHSSSSLVFKRLRGSWISFCTKGFSELLQLTVSSQCLPGVITWWHLKHSAAVLGSGGFGDYSSGSACTELFFQPWDLYIAQKNPKLSLWRVVLWSESDCCWWPQGLSPAIWLRPCLVEMSNDVSCSAVMSMLNHSCQNPSIHLAFNMPLNSLHARFLLVPGGGR